MIDFKDCAKYYKQEPHQDKAWEYLQQNTTNETLETFALIFRGNKQVEPVGEEPTVTSQAGIDLIKEFEGCELKAYYCPAGILTIGYGHTGPDVLLGMTITLEKAEALLVEDLHYFEHEVRKLINVPLKQQEFDAIVSFTYNVGAGNLSSSTFRVNTCEHLGFRQFRHPVTASHNVRRMNNGDSKPQCFREEFMRWVNGPNGPLPGLVRRRDAEVELATS